MNKARFLKTIILNDYESIKKQCQEFSDKMYTAEMTERHKLCGSNKDRSQLVDSNMKSKLAEFAVQQYFNELGLDTSPIDLEVYGVEKKSHSADLLVFTKDNRTVEIAIKSQHVDSINKFGASALIMKNSYKRQLNKEVIFVETSDDLSTYNIYRCGKMKDLEIGIPKSRIARDKKHAFYFELN